MRGAVPGGRADSALGRPIRASRGCPNTCGDINGSGGNIDLIDFAHYLLCHNSNNPNPPDCDANEFDCSDLTGNGTVNFLDFATFALYFNASTTKTPPNCAGGPP